jgi:hypothetical protein
MLDYEVPLSAPEGFVDSAISAPMRKISSQERFVQPPVVFVGRVLTADDYRQAIYQN